MFGLFSSLTTLLSLDLLVSFSPLRMGVRQSIDATDIGPTLAPRNIHVNHRLEAFADGEQSGVSVVAVHQQPDAPQDLHRVPCLRLRHGPTVTFAAATQHLPAAFQPKVQYEPRDLAPENSPLAPLLVSVSPPLSHAALKLERRRQHTRIELDLQTKVARAVVRRVHKRPKQIQLVEVEVLHDATVGKGVRGGGDQRREFNVELAAGRAEGVQDRDGGVGELDGEDTVVFAGLVRLEESAAEDCEDSGLWGDGGGGGVDLEAVFGREGLEGVVEWRHGCCCFWGAGCWMLAWLVGGKVRSMGICVSVWLCSFKSTFAISSEVLSVVSPAVASATAFALLVLTVEDLSSCRVGVGVRE
jgi:hypothetical protein